MKNGQENGRVAVLMSGGVDSSVAAALLKEQGHDVVGLTYSIGPSAVSRQPSAGKNLPTPDPRPLSPARRCCGVEDATDAGTVAHQLGIPHYTVNVSEFFRSSIIDTFTRSYFEGRTPLPCAVCNTEVKWGEMAAKASEFGAGRIGSGHYARVEWDAKRGRHILKQAADLEKDQSYFLFGLDQAQLARAIFPLGDLTKPQVRQRAESLGLVVSDKAESQDLCFVPSSRYVDLLSSNVERRTSNMETPPPFPSPLDGEGARGGGQIVDMTGRVMGTHDGYYKFTVGQRKGLGLSGGPYYVVRIDPDTRRVTVGREKDLMADRLVATSPNLIGHETWDDVGRVKARIRYRHKGEWCRVRWDGGVLHVEFESAVRAVTPGQAVVFYRDDEVVGGAWIAGGGQGAGVRDQGS